MKISIEVSNFFAEINPLIKKIEEISVPVFRKVSNNFGGFFDYRIKSPESLTQKLFRGEIKKPIDHCDDLFAGTIVLPSRDQMEKVIETIQEKFLIRKEIRNRIKRPTEFGYDDIHLIITIRPEKFEVEGPLHKFQIELQIKTLLQYAISKATHDILYKGEKETSRRIRLAAQLRAMLEMAEGLMSKLELADEILEFEENNVYTTRANICDFIKETWDIVDRPTDMRRAALSIENYFNLAKISHDDFKELLKEEKYSSILSLRSIDPILAVLAILLIFRGDDLITRAKSKNVYFLIPKEIEELLPVLGKVPHELRIEFSSGF